MADITRTDSPDDETRTSWHYEAASEYGEVGVDLSADDGEEFAWTIAVAAAEFIREEPLESEFRAAVEAAARRVAGVTDVVEEDRETWLAAGDPDGAELTEAVALAVEPFAERLEAEFGEDAVGEAFGSGDEEDD